MYVCLYAYADVAFAIAFIHKEKRTNWTLVKKKPGRVHGLTGWQQIATFLKKEKRGENEGKKAIKPFILVCLSVWCKKPS